MNRNMDDIIAQLLDKGPGEPREMAKLLSTNIRADIQQFLAGAKTVDQFCHRSAVVLKVSCYEVLLALALLGGGAPIPQDVLDDYIALLRDCLHSFNPIVEQMQKGKIP